MSNCAIALSLALLGGTLLAPSAQAQRTAPGPAGHGGMGASRGGGFGGRPAYVPRVRRYFAGPGYFPYYNSGSDSGYDYGPPMGAPSPQVVFVPITPPAAPEPPPKPAEAEVIELQGDHWVRLSPNGPPQIVGGSTQQPRAANSSPSVAITPARPAVQAATPTAVPASAMLVFRDGHQEQIGKYTIMGTTIYISTEYWTSGAWTRRVQIAELDVPATLKLNRERGANFRLPSGPEEVMIGP